MALPKGPLHGVRVVFGPIYRRGRPSFALRTGWRVAQTRRVRSQMDRCCNATAVFSPLHGHLPSYDMRGRVVYADARQRGSSGVSVTHDEN